WCWSLASTFTANRSAASNAASDDDERDAAHMTKGGFSETEVNELAVIAKRSPSASTVVTTVTPVAYWPSARRRSRVSNRDASTAVWAARNRCASAGSYHHGLNSLASSNPAAMVSATAGCAAAASTTARWCAAAGRNQLLVQS